VLPLPPERPRGAERVDRPLELAPRAVAELRRGSRGARVEAFVGVPGSDGEIRLGPHFHPFLQQFVFIVFNS
jgi:hypothetical protein